MRIYQSQAARDEAGVYGDNSYADYLDEHAQRMHDYYMRHGDPERAKQMLTRTLSETLMGNDGE